jgi:hypothetical protein
MGPAQPPDLIVSSLLAHHLDNARIVELLRFMETHARHGWLTTCSAARSFIALSAPSVPSRNSIPWSCMTGRSPSRAH